MMGGKKMMNRFHIKLTLNARVLLVVFVAIMLVGIFSNQNFFTMRNFLSILQQMSEIGIMALGMTVVIITGGIDISSGTTMGLCATVTGMCMSLGWPTYATLACSLAVATLCGLINASMVAVIRVPAMIATLGTQMFFNGVALALSKGSSISQIYESFYFLGQGTILGIPVQALVLIVLAILVHILLKHRIMGKRIYAIGNNSKAAMYSGVNTVRVLFGVYILSAVMACIAGNIQVSRVTTARADMGTIFVMQCISAVVLGGTSISGGKGNVGGTIVSVLIFSMISNIMNLVGISTFWQQFATGSILVLVVVLNRITEQSRRQIKTAG